ncbi:sensor histidine kinase [Paenibacillus daejeonensis]|uniref:sensor histidine kinase n=1 Tax=Paenibacillus daejeonensis TaxID=135193 RepID=UPI0003712D6C|nr:sensor histidine kinase [Paenibacillus daejeonensis]
MFTRGMKFFHKVLLIYTVIFAVSVFIMAQIITGSFASDSLKSSINYNKLVLYNVERYIQEKKGVLLQAAQHIHYRSGNEERPSIFLEQPNSQDNEYFFSRKRLIEYMESVYAFDSNITAVSIYKLSTDSYYNVSRFRTTIINAGMADYNGMLKKMEKNSTKVSVYPGRLTDSIVDGSFYTMAINLKSIETYETVGILLVEFNTTGIEETYKQHYEKPIGMIHIENGEGNVIYTTDGGNKGEHQSEAIVKLDKELRSFDSQARLYNEVYSEELDLRIVGTMHKIEALSEIKWMQKLVYFLSSLCILIMFIFSLIVTKVFSNRISSILTAFRKVRKGFLETRIRLPKSMDELHEISDGFNTMCDDLQNYINKVYISELRQRKAEMSALQAQINPHYLYNTLEAIRLRAISTGAEEAAEMIFILSKLFRNAVDKETITTINEELENIRLYLELFHIRFGDRLRISFEIDEETLDYGIMRHTLQPILENYVIHGFDGSLSDNQIWIKTIKLEKLIRIEIEDNGSGIPEEKLDHILNQLQTPEQDTDSIGLKNVNERIRLAMGSNYGIHIQSKASKGTKVVITLAAMKVEEFGADV